MYIRDFSGTFKETDKRNKHSLKKRRVKSQHYLDIDSKEEQISSNSIMVMKVVSSKQEWMVPAESTSNYTQLGQLD